MTKIIFSNHHNARPIEYYVNENGCWICTSHNGTMVNGRRRIKINYKKIIISRYMYERFVGNIPEGMLVCHKCDNPDCINPDHLFLGTHQDNYDDMRNKGRERKSRGSKQHNSKLTEYDVIEIRRDMLPYNESRFKDIISASQYNKIKNKLVCGKTWLWI